MKIVKKQSLFWIIIFFGFLAAAFFYQTILSGKIPVPADTLVGLYHPWRDLYAQTNPRGVPFKNFLITDPIRQQIPWRKISIDQWKDGHAPSWNAYSFGGVRLDSNIQAAGYYPLNIIFFVFNFVTAWSLLVMVQPLIAGVGLFLYLRHHKLSSIASVFGAVSWAFGGFSIAWLTWGTIMQTAMWLPILLLCLDHIIKPRILRNEEIRWVSAFCVVMFFMMSAGHSQVALYGAIVAGLYGLRLYKLEKYSNQTFKMLISRVSVIGLVSILITIPIWFPQLEMLGATVRIAQQTHPVGWFLPWQNLVQFIAPDFFGNPATLNYWGIWNYGEFIGYIGVISLIFAISAMFTTSMAVFWTWIFLGAVFFMLPHPITFLFSSIKVPLLGVLQPTRLMMPAVLALCILASYGVDGWRVSSKRVIGSVALIGVLMFLLWGIVFIAPMFLPTLGDNLHIALRNLFVPTLVFMISTALLSMSRFFSKSHQSYILVALCILSIVDIFRFGWKFTPFTDVKYFFPKTKVIEYLQKQPQPYRIAAVDDRLLPSNTTAFYGIESVDGYDPLALLRYENFLTASERNKPDLTRPTGFNRIYTAHNIYSTLFPLFGAQYILSIDTLNAPWLTLVFQEGQTKVYKNSMALPRVYLAEQIDVASANDPQIILTSVFGAIKQHRPAIIEKVAPVLSLPLGVDESVSITSYEADQIKLRSHTTNPRLVVVLNSYDKGWRATVDGKKTSIIRVNYLFLGVVVPAGSHEVELIHR